ncbi:hypothetical protein QTN25_000803 [Entamoeba marina]
MFGLLFFLLVNALSQDYYFIDKYWTDSNGNFAAFNLYLMDKCYSWDTAVEPTYCMANENADGTFCYNLYNDNQCSDSVYDECSVHTSDDLLHGTVNYIAYIITGYVESNDVELTSDYKREYYTDMCYQYNDRYGKVVIEGLNLRLVWYSDSSCTTRLDDTSFDHEISLCSSTQYNSNDHYKTKTVCNSGSITGIPLESSESEQESSSSVSSDIPQQESSSSVSSDIPQLESSSAVSSDIPQQESSNEQSSNNDFNNGTSMTNIFGAITLLFLLMISF